MFNKKNLFYLIPAFFLFACQTKEEDSSTGVKDSEVVDETTSSETEENTSSEETTAEGANPSSSSEMAEEGQAGQSQTVMPEGIPPLAADYKHILVNRCTNGSTTRAVAITYLHENAMNTPPDQQPSGEFQVPCEVHYFKNDEWKKEAWANHTASHCPYIGGLISGRLSRGGYDCQGPIPLVEEPVREETTATMTSNEGMSSEVVEENGGDSSSTSEDAGGVVLEEETDTEASASSDSETEATNDEEEFEDL